MDIFNLDTLLIWFKHNSVLPLFHIIVIRIIAQYVNVWVFRTLSFSFELNIMYVALKYAFNFSSVSYLIQFTAQLCRKVSRGMGTGDRRVEWTLLKETRSWFSKSRTTRSTFCHLPLSVISAPPLPPPFFFFFSCWLGSITFDGRLEISKGI